LRRRLSATAQEDFGQHKTKIGQNRPIFYLVAPSHNPVDNPLATMNLLLFFPLFFVIIVFFYLVLYKIAKKIGFFGMQHSFNGE